jgi:hypothetical protein
MTASVHTALGETELTPALSARRSPEQPQATLRWPSLATRLASATLLVALAVALVTWLRYGWTALAFPYPLDYGEGPLLDQAVALSRFEPIYRVNLTVPPYTVANYPPLYVVAQTPFVWLFGPAFWYGRLISLLGALATALFIGLTICALSGDRMASLFGGAIFLAVPYVVNWAPLSRVDMLALALSWAGLYAVARRPTDGRMLCAGAVLLTAAIFTRQSYTLAAPLAAVVWLGQEYTWRRGVRLALAVGGLTLCIGVLLEVLTQGGFVFNVVRANVNEFLLWRVRWRFTELWTDMPFLVLGGVGYVLEAARQRLRSLWMAAAYLVGATGSALAIGKTGSNVNYLLELAAGLAFASALLLASQRQRRGLYGALTLLLALQIGAMVVWSQRPYRDWLHNKVAESSEVEQLLHIVEGTRGPVLADEFMGLLPLAGRRIHLQPFELTQLARVGLWNDEPIVDAIRAQEFPTILIEDSPLRAQRWTPGMRDALEASYIPVEKLARTVVYRPRN